MRLAYRPFQAVVLALLAALVTGGAAFAPLYDRAMQQALTDLEVTSATPAVLGLRATATTSVAVQSADAGPPEPETAAAGVPDGLAAAYQRPILGYAGSAELVSGAARQAVGGLLWRDGQCDHLTIEAGRCPTAGGEIAISAADAKVLDLAPGSRVVVRGAVPTGRAEDLLRLRVVGVATQRATTTADAAYWTGLVLGGSAGLANADDPTVVDHDVWLTGRDTFEGDIPVADSSSSAQFLLDPDRVDVDELLRLGTGISTQQAELTRRTSSAATVILYSGLPGLADDVRRQIDQSRVTVPLLMAQVVLLSVVVLWLVLLAATEQRRPEVAVARLRGRGRRGAVVYLLGELAPTVLAGVVPGGLLAVLGAWLARGALPGHAGFELTRAYAVALALAVVVLAGAVLLAAVRVAREPLEVLLRRIPPRRGGWGLGAADALLVAGAGGVVLGFLTGGLDGPVALAAPGLMAIVVGLLVAHLVTPTAAAAGRRLLRRGRVRAGLAVLDAARSPATRRVVTMVTLATALAVFAGDAVLVGARNRTAAAEQDAGAPAVLVATGGDLADFRAALTRADDGRGLVTPVVRSLPPGSDEGGTLSVVPAEFGRIALLPPGAAAQLARLRAPATEPVRITGSRVALTVTGSDVTAVSRGGGRARTEPVRVGLDMIGARGDLRQVALGQLTGPVASRRLSAAVQCPDGCTVVAVRLTTLVGSEMGGSTTLALIGAPLGPADRWISDDGRDPESPGGFLAHDATGGGLRIEVSSRGGASITLPSAWAPPRVGAVVSRPAPRMQPGGTFTTSGIDGEEQDAVRVASLPRVPGGRPGTVVVDLDVVDRVRTAGSQSTLEAWLGRDDPRLVAEVRSALAERGIDVGSVRTLSGVRRGYDSSTAAWSLDLAVLVGLASLLVAALVLVVGAASAWRLRTRDLAALRMSGLSRRTLAAVVVAAQVPAVLAGLVGGAAAGLAGAVLALPIVPLFASAPLVSTLDLSTAWDGVLLAAGLAAAILLVTAVVIGRSLARRADVRRLRETL